MTRDIKRLVRVLEATGWWTASDGIPHIDRYLEARATELHNAITNRKLVLERRGK